MEDNHLKRILGRWKFLTVWTNDLAALQAIDALVASLSKRRAPNQTLQCVCLLMTSVVVLALPTGPPFHMRGGGPAVHNHLWQRVGETWYIALGIFWNFWCHLLAAFMQVIQALAFGPIRASNFKGYSYCVCLAFILSWILFSELLVRNFARLNDDGSVQFPYGALMQMPLRPLFYIVLALIVFVLVMIYQRLGLIQVTGTTVSVELERMETTSEGSSGNELLVFGRSSLDQESE